MKAFHLRACAASDITVEGRPPSIGADSFRRSYEALRAAAVFDDWSDADVARLVPQAAIRRHLRGSRVVAPGSRELVVVASGCVELSCINVEGAKFVKTLLRRGDCSGVIRLLRAQNSAYDCVAREDCTIVHLPCSALVTMLDAQPILWRSVALYALQKHLDDIAAIQHRALSNVPESLASMLVKLVDSVDQPVGGRSGASVYLNQSEIGAMLGVSRQTVNKELRKLSARGTVSTDYGRVDVNDVGALRELASRSTGAQSQTHIPT